MPAVDDLDPIFLSYRHSDGDVLAARMVWVLRSYGVPVWHDQTHLAPGQFHRRLHEALNSGLSGAVLLLTPDIVHSKIVREQELPALLTLEADPAFTFAIGNVITDAAGVLDYGAPDRLLPQPGWTLQAFDQFPVVDHAGMAKLAGEMAVRRVRRAAPDGELRLDVQTRLPPLGTPKAPLAVRTRAPFPGTSVPPPEVWQDIAPFLGDLPRLVQAAGADRVRVTGGAHLSVAFALGAAVPATSGIAVSVMDLEGQAWGGGSAPAVRLTEEEIVLDNAPGGPAAVYLDLVPAPPNKEFRRYAESHPFSRAVEITVTEREVIPAEAGLALARELRWRIDEIAAGGPVHLFLRAPFPVAVLLGRACNTMRVVLYEWERETATPGYMEMATVSAGRSGSPVISWNSER
ncbi:SAVED domain-containing protein [Lentzea sp. NPDC059081]|uniref:SAVED domain-containing protein n=1 Tax=Lentzea sp. NPDC059081 TaxID=3346719 RepID=UPI00369522E0